MTSDIHKPRPDPISIRLSEELKADLSNAANQAGRSLNAEIRMRLELSFKDGRDAQVSDRALAHEVEGLRGELRQSVTNLNATIRELENRLTAVEGSRA